MESPATLPQKKNPHRQSVTDKHGVRTTTCKTTSIHDSSGCGSSTQPALAIYSVACSDESAASYAAGATA